ncbi:MAG: nuclease-related domain-containing protein, partial [Acidimicrobiales bacterium]
GKHHVRGISSYHEAMPDTVPARRWVQRAEGERRSRARLHLVEGNGVIVLDDRRVPGSMEAIRLIAVSPAGVFVIESKRYKGLVHTMRPGTIGKLGPHELHVGRRNCTRSVEAVHRQAKIVRATLGAAPPWVGEVPVHAMLCLTRAEWGFGSAVRIGDVWVGWPRLMAGQVQAPGVLHTSTVERVSTMITDRLPGHRPGRPPT